MFERFTTRARRVVVLSQEEATQMSHNYIGTEHILLGLLGEQGGLASQALTGLGMSLEGARKDVADLIGLGSTEPTGRIPFTPRAKKTLELALREALQLNHDYIGTEHLLLGILTQGERAGQDEEGVGVKVLRRYAELPVVRTAVMNLLPAGGPESGPMRRWRRARLAGVAELATHLEAGTTRTTEHAMNATPAADATLSEAARLAGTQPVGSHHLLLASLSDPGTAAARALAALGVDLDQAKEALRGMDVTGTSDELPEEAGRRQMFVRVIGDRLTLEAWDPVLVKAGSEAIAALDDATKESGTIPGDLPVSASLSRTWLALFESLQDIKRRAPSSVATGSSAEPAAASVATGSSAEPAAASVATGSSAEPAAASAGAASSAEPAAGPSAGASAGDPDVPDS